MAYKIEQDWESSGLRCVVAALDMGHRCGYVGVPSSHPLFGISSSQALSCLAPMMERIKEQPIGKRGIIPLVCYRPDEPPTLEILIDVHGSLTYSNGKDYPVEGSGLWWFGFDCGHDGDAKDPSIMEEEYRDMDERHGFPSYGTIRDLNYVSSECEVWRVNYWKLEHLYLQLLMQIHKPLTKGGCRAIAERG